MQLEPIEHSSSDQEPKLSKDRGALLTPDDLAIKMRVTPEQVRTLIRQGLLNAINIGTGKKRPLYRITRKAYDEFLENRQKPRGRKLRKKFNRLPSAPDFFPNLK